MTVQTAPHGRGLERRLSRRGTVQLFMLVVALSAYAAVTADVVLEGALVRLDRDLSQLASPVQAGWLTSVAEALGVAGSTPIQGAVLAIVAVTLAGTRRRWEPLVVASLAGFWLVALVIALKASMGRIGPQDHPGDVPWGGAFPSGHAAAAVVVTSVLILLLRDHVSVAARRRLMVVAAAWAGLVGWSRVHINVHWFSDVLAGWALGIVVACAVCIASEMFTNARRERLP